MNSVKKKICLIATGGTISAHHEDRLDFRNYVTGYYSGNELINHIPELSEIAMIDVVQLGNFSSTFIKDDDWIVLHRKITDLLTEYDGVVITHGTNTIEETAYYLHLSVYTDKPIVLTGAQRPFSALGSDAQINLIEAVKVASSDQAIGKGVLVVMNNHIHSAREVTKESTYRLHSFQLTPQGELGAVDPDGTIQFYFQSLRRFGLSSQFAKKVPEHYPKVDIIYSYAGAEGDAIRAFIDKSCKGIVVAGTGAGRVSPLELEAIEEALEKEIVIVMSSRVRNGRVVPIDCYKHHHFITSDNLTPQKARILLKMSLSQNLSLSEIQEAYHHY